MTRDALTTQHSSLIDINLFATVAKTAEERIIPFHDVKYARLLITSVYPFFERNHQYFEESYKELADKWDHIFILLKWIVLHTLEADGIIEMMEEHFTKTYEIPSYNIIEQARAMLLTMNPEKRDDLKVKIREALLRNKELLTDAGVVLGTHEEQGTVGNWLSDYNQKLGTDPISQVDFVEYLINSQNTADLNEVDRAKLEILLTFYEHLKYSSFSIEGMEEEIAFIDVDGSLKLFSQGQVFDVGRKGKDEFQSMQNILEEQGAKEFKAETVGNEIIDQFNRLPIPLTIIHEKMEDIKRRLQNEPELITQIMQNPDKVKDKSYLIAALLLAAVQRHFGGAGVKDSKYFIRNLLENKLGWSEDDSAKIGIRIGNILGSPFKGSAYYNKASKKFEWGK